MNMCLLLRKVLKGYFASTTPMVFIQTMSVITFRYRQTKSEEIPPKKTLTFQIPNWKPPCLFCTKHQPSLNFSKLKRKGKYTKQNCKIIYNSRLYILMTHWLWCKPPCRQTRMSSSKYFPSNSDSPPHVVLKILNTQQKGKGSAYG